MQLQTIIKYKKQEDQPSYTIEDTQMKAMKILAVAGIMVVILTAYVSAGSVSLK